MKIISYTLSQLQDKLPQIWKIVKSYRVIALQGALGSGKTTFTRALCHYLNASPEASSPTFSLINEYHYKEDNGTERTIYHADWYRLESTMDAINAGMEDMLLQPAALVMVEWPERAAALLPDNTLFLRFEVIDEHTRELRVEADGL